jgi:DNA-binding response OmpR family regulator
MTAGDVSSCEPSGSPKPSRRLRIVVVDDDRDMVATLATLLQDQGHLVKGVYRAQEVMDTIKDVDPDVVLLDIALPDGSGYALAEQIRGRNGSARPMVIALTGIYNRPPHDRLSRIAGCDYFLTKPFEFGELLRLIQPLTLQSGPTPR